MNAVIDAMLRAAVYEAHSGFIVTLFTFHF